MYSKSILLIEDKRFAHYIRQTLNNAKKEVDDSYPLLNDIETLRGDLLLNRNTRNFRASLAQFIKYNGFPFLFIIDYTVDLGLRKDEDPDKHKLMRTVLIAYIILASAKGYSNAVANIVFLISKKETPMIESFIKNPVLLMNQIKTRDERVNALINTFFSDIERVKNFFNISYLYQPGNSDFYTEIERLNKIIEETKNRIEAIDKIKEERKQIKDDKTTAMNPEDLEPADVICRATMDKLLINGELREITEEEKKLYQEKTIVLNGPLTVRTMHIVKDRILATFNAMAKIHPFKKDERLFIEIPDSSAIDGSVASSLGTFLTNTLSRYRGISLNIGDENLEKLKNSRAYFAIEDFVLKEL
ncbi:MAG: hypothetical protein ACUVWJ_07530 [Spirochaetota bacterium]